MLKLVRRTFSYTEREVMDLERKFTKRMNTLKMYNENKDFNYEPPQMMYDKESGEVVTIKKDRGPKKKIIRNMEEYEKEK
jgi:hypothetical protein